MITIAVENAKGNQLTAGLDPISRSDAGLQAVLRLAREHKEVWAYVPPKKWARISARMSRRTVARLLSSLEG
jgi:hypothetical protein